MRYGIVILPQADWPEAARYWQGAEALGFDHAWTYDHLAWRGLAGERWHATVPTLTAAAMVTERIGLGTFVASPNYRHPVPFAKDLATVDQIAGGRMLLGFGSGGTGFDAFVLGQAELTPRERHERFAEFAEALDTLLRFETPGGPDASGGAGISFEGEWYTADSARMVGEPAQRPRMPLHLAANGPRGLELTVRIADGWITTGGEHDDAEVWWTGVERLARRLDDACESAGRVPGSLARTLSLDAEGRYSLESVGAFEDAVGRATELGFTDVVAHWPRTEGVYAGRESVLEEVASRLDRLR
ncbi:LLM class flavin-dependent oxidoreductase [Agromyces aerolatus]|uniref:LLM class flavin-dependent oxidoreductase n=1 Tax=Agromyces sp. LY-1074 TaxID=3074080 RepID=UPI00285623C2|nr:MULTISPECIES: LLM class flavin-dependent oxidoreductase [unclassified Agromyces]MDR5701065.1 LLM class flavin-dependent oxidoreductase [Agromyces sp. LY-1074]MDR5707705.1 LLM class flavin-dependent oxidoreductase [Agromyces sp. LY-1358]